MIWAGDQKEAIVMAIFQESHSTSGQDPNRGRVVDPGRSQPTGSLAPRGQRIDRRRLMALGGAALLGAAVAPGLGRSLAAAAPTGDTSGAGQSSPTPIGSTGLTYTTDTPRWNVDLDRIDSSVTLRSESTDPVTVRVLNEDNGHTQDLTLAAGNAQSFRTDFKRAGGFGERYRLSTVQGTQVGAFVATIRLTQQEIFLAQLPSRGQAMILDLHPAGQNFDDVRWAMDHLVATGFPQELDVTNVRPGDAVTRGELASMFLRYSGEDFDGRGHGNPFADVPEKNEHVAGIKWMHERGISTGWPHPSGARAFRPDEAVRRDSFAALLHAYAQYKDWQPPGNSGTGLEYADITPSMEHYEHMQWMGHWGLLTREFNDPTTFEYRPLEPTLNPVVCIALRNLGIPAPELAPDSQS